MVRGQQVNRSSMAQLERDAALGRVGRTRRVIILSAAGLTAGFAALASAIVPGKSFGAKAATATAKIVPNSARPAASATMPPLATAGQLGLQGPSQAPQSAPSTQSQASSADQSAAAAQAQADAQAQAQAQQSAAASQQAPAVSGGS
jgi:hypothetical protein